LPLDGRDSLRSLEEERARWHEDDLNDPRREDLMARHGWMGVSTGMITRPREHLNVLAYLDKLDPEFATLWEQYTYQGMYGRGILDDRTRILCIIGNRAHIRSALHIGAAPKEILEVILQSCIHFGMPPTMQALATFYRVMDDLGRLEEIGNPAFPQREWTR
jgi:alkylhydroperoxidase/carboxymuconolactone decarboxylase family protein YurZ